MPERRKKSSGASRPSMVKTTSLSSRISLPASSFSDDVGRLDADDLRSEGEADRAPAFQGPKLLEALGFRAAEGFLSVGERHRGARRGERDGGLDGGVTAPDDENLLPREVFGIVESIEDLVEVLSGHAEPAVRAALSDRDDRPPGFRSFPAGVMEHEPVTGALDPLDARARDLDSGLSPLPLEVGEELFLRMHFRPELQPARRGHADRVGVDRFAFREVHDGREGLGRFVDAIAKPRLFRLDRRGDPRHAAAHDGQVENRGRGSLAASKIGLGEDRAHGPRAAVRRELEKRDPREVARDPQAGDGRCAVLADFGKLVDGSGRPPRVEPPRVPRQDVHRPP